MPVPISVAPEILSESFLPVAIDAYDVSSAGIVPVGTFVCMFAASAWL
jgi:hypothetical protein